MARIYVPLALPAAFLKREVVQVRAGLFQIQHSDKVPARPDLVRRAQHPLLLSHLCHVQGIHGERSMAGRERGLLADDGGWLEVLAAGQRGELWDRAERGDANAGGKPCGALLGGVCFPDVRVGRRNGRVGRSREW